MVSSTAVTLNASVSGAVLWIGRRGVENKAAGHSATVLKRWGSCFNGNHYRRSSSTGCQLREPGSVTVYTALTGSRALHYLWSYVPVDGALQVTFMVSRHILQYMSHACADAGMHDEW
jgi:hypothetical protein